MWSTIAKTILKLFSKAALGTLFSKLLSSAKSAVVSELTDTENQKKAYEFVKELNARTDLSTVEKAKEFNRKFIEFGHSVDKKVSESVINCLRELAVNAIKGESGK